VGDAAAVQLAEHAAGRQCQGEEGGDLERSALESIAKGDETVILDRERRVRTGTHQLASPRHTVDVEGAEHLQLPSQLLIVGAAPVGRGRDLQQDVLAVSRAPAPVQHERAVAEELGADLVIGDLHAPAGRRTPRVRQLYRSGRPRITGP
jgi:hypothetical protein